MMRNPRIWRVCCLLTCWHCPYADASGLLLDRRQDEVLDSFVERCRKKLRKAKDCQHRKHRKRTVSAGSNIILLQSWKQLHTVEDLFCKRCHGPRHPVQMQNTLIQHFKTVKENRRNYPPWTIKSSTNVDSCKFNWNGFLDFLGSVGFHVLVFFLLYCWCFFDFTTFHFLWHSLWFVLVELNYVGLHLLCEYLANISCKVFKPYLHCFVSFCPLGPLDEPSFSELQESNILLSKRRSTGMVLPYFFVLHPPSTDYFWVGTRGGIWSEFFEERSRQSRRRKWSRSCFARLAAPFVFETCMQGIRITMQGFAWGCYLNICDNA